MNLTSLDIHYAVRELQAFTGGKIEKVFQSDREKRDLCLTLYHPDHPKTHVRFHLPGLVCAYARKPHYQQMPPGFAMFLRKYVTNARIKAVEQRGFDRILEFKMENKQGPLSLVFEMIPPGNVLLVIDGKVKGLLENQNYKDRTLRGGIPYEPPEPAFDPIGSTKEDIVQEMKASDRDSIVTTLAMTVGLGGVYAEEVCARLGIDKDRDDLSDEELEKVAGCIKELTDTEIDTHADGKRAYPFRMEGRDAEPTSGPFLSALASFVPEREKPKDRRLEKLENMRKQQEKSIREQQERAERSREKAERIYEEYQRIQAILDAAAEARDEGKDIAEALEKFPEVKKYHAKNQEIEIEL